MKIFYKVLILLFLTVLSSCNNKHLINNKQYLSKVEANFSEREKLAVNRSTELFSVFNRNLTQEQTEALKFLFAYSPINDLADQNGNFFLANSDIALKVRKETPWHDQIPEDIFLHYILPFRVNNENPDSFRIAYYEEINKRVAGMDEVGAALEINHWCHEKVSYMPSDIRTSGPLGTILSARGRCGEESTFTVAALRTAGIPARQVYTPRWAHSDDNHAWVEVWINGEWYYMGACEPEPVLDRGWFTEPARRAMLIHTKSFGAPAGNENSVLTTRFYTEVNNLSKYAVTKTIYARVLDNNNSPVPDAAVEFQLYNYAEFYPLAMVLTDPKGICRFETGLGDLVIWARKGEAFNFKKITVNDVDTLTLRIDREAGKTENIDLDLGVPVVRPPLRGPDERTIAENTRRIDAENAIRQKYIESWMKPADAVALALRTGFDTTVIKDIIKRSMGNGRTIAAFLEKSLPSGRPSAIDLLNVIADKDLRDITVDALSDHLKNVTVSAPGQGITDEDFNKYVLNPRIANELIVSWRGYFLKSLPEDLKAEGIKDPAAIVRYLNEKIKIASDENYYMTPITPCGVFELKVSDSFSRDICFVAICRTLGIPAQLESGTKVPQYFFKGKWVDARFADQTNPLPGKGYLKLVSDEKNPVPEYFIHFTLARFENGRFNTLEYDYNRRVTDFNDELILEPGHYMLVTGNRINDSRILSSLKFFDLGEKEHKVLRIALRK
jgi:hypothetical protein